SPCAFDWRGLGSFTVKSPGTVATCYVEGPSDGNCIEPYEGSYTEPERPLRLIGNARFLSCLLSAVCRIRAARSPSGGYQEGVCFPGWPEAARRRHCLLWGNGNVRPLAFATAIKDMKALLHNA